MVCGIQKWYGSLTLICVGLATWMCVCHVDRVLTVSSNIRFCVSSTTTTDLLPDFCLRPRLTLISKVGVRNTASSRTAAVAMGLRAVCPPTPGPSAAAARQSGPRRSSCPPTEPSPPTQDPQATLGSSQTCLENVRFPACEDLKKSRARSV